MKLLRSAIILAFVGLFTFLVSFTSKRTEERNNQSVLATLQLQDGEKVAYFASGCFWCVEAIFESVNGVREAVSGYAGGHTDDPTYRKIGTGRTGHAETVAVYYNPKKVNFQNLVDVFFGSHNPTTKNGQHPDYGSQYRSIAFYSTAAEKNVIEKTIKQLNKEVYNGKIATEVTKYSKFYPAEAYHQNYERLHPENPYVQQVSIPRLNRFKRKFPHLLKKSAH